MSRISNIFFVICITICYRIGIAEENVFLAYQDPKYEEPIRGVNMSVKAFSMACWYEWAKQFPNSNAHQFISCILTPDEGRKGMLKQDLPKQHPDLIAGWFGKQLEAFMNRLPKQYNENCGKYLNLKDIQANYDVNYAKLLQDEEKNYPLKAFSHCLIHNVEKTHGKEAIQTFQEYLEGREGKLDWRKVMLDRHNLMRERHGVPPLKMLEDLNKSAQERANFMAQVCGTDRSTKLTPFEAKVTLREPEYNGLKGICGEGGWAFNSHFENYLAAYTVPNSWYEGIQSYDFKTHKSTNGKDVGHFRNIVWLRTEYAGFGHSYNASCPRVNTFVYAQYYPSGNVNGKAAENVFPPK